MVVWGEKGGEVGRDEGLSEGRAGRGRTGLGRARQGWAGLGKAR